MKENLKIFKQIHKLEHELFILHCQELENCLIGKNTEELEDRIILKEREMAQLQKKLYKE